MIERIAGDGMSIVEKKPSQRAGERRKRYSGTTVWNGRRG